MITPRRPRPPRRGFTMIELIIVMVIIGIIGAMVSSFIRLPVQSYVDAVARADVTDVADTAMRRFSRDLRRALPNSIRVDSSGQVLELLLTKTGGRYLAETDNLGATGALSFTTATTKTFTVVGDLPTGRESILAGDSIVVYNLGEGMEPANAYNCAAAEGCNRATVASVNNSTRVVTMSSNPFASQTPAMPSPTSRFQVVSTPVSYHCDLRAGVMTLTRYSGYAIQASQPTSGGGAPDATLQGASSQGLLANNVQACSFTSVTLPNVQRGLVGLTLTIGKPTDPAGPVVLNQQVHVDNSP
ncbi:MAG: prepilin-type N-terminal cleavage/methylation domain-containing protein [Pseudomonadota bacterium]